MKFKSESNSSKASRMFLIATFVAWLLIDALYTRDRDAFLSCSRWRARLHMHLYPPPPHRVVATTHICIQIRRGQWEIDMGRIRYVSLSLYMSLCTSCLFMQSMRDWTNAPLQFRRIAFVRIEKVRRVGWYLFARKIYIYALRNPGNLVALTEKGIGKESTNPANPTRISGVTNEEGID